MTEHVHLRAMIAERLTRLKHERTLSLGRNVRQEDVAAGAGISRSHVANAMGGKTGVSIENLVALAKFYNVTLDYIVGLAPSDARAPDDFAQNSDERALLDAWRTISEEDRMGLRLALRNAKIASNSNAA